ncbi:TPA: GNAT family N-acetyltransferase [Raoultella ornithinolytica]|uniref:GNAT family N-acetyltransferase n=1 Tax=Raoultella ornithinolytica TaxID=54291 RepID=UPI0004D546D7|nr:GNAT family N-acetyltransferase [Raoultella ornithinolytica]EKW7681533.1 GNAT family N-acetyltransferase [Raoultella ornithinolytica]ELN4411258.1 GNAT family N-acetyltransferase [Raoultella ornithinolytica]ELS1884044.1 GNAT family N-acetyltransferase [Raoultella ornithinolytica]KDV95250.1 acetyltransferase family protein [Raoultella ornithinolytica 2-156-04_S1_C1]KDX16088.1 acetyltransferase family protein [Raoultella ornithinolytica 2-156-04_S1_C2]
MKYKLVKQVVHDDVLRNSFINLAIKTFDLSFKEWYKKGYWTESYIPYAFVDHNKVIANASANIIDLMWQGEPRRYIQIGTVMTATDYREKGLASQLINHILADWQEQADGIFLFANSTTVDFYPKFGFEQTDEYQYALPVTPVAGDFRKLDMDKESDVNILKYYYQKANPFSRLSAHNNFGLLMFYCSAFMKHFVYYSEKNNAVAIAMQNDHALLCFDIFCDSTSSMTRIVNELAAQHTRQVILGFTPREDRAGEYEKIEIDDFLFIYAAKENIFKERKLMFPTLSHA